MDYIEENYLSIKSIDASGISFADGKRIVFTECLHQRYDSDTYVADRDISAVPSYFVFCTPGRPTRIVFTKTGFRSKARNRSDFIELQKKINDAGYRTRDLS